MESKKDLEYFKNLSYKVIISRKNDKYSLFIPELGLVVKGNDIKETYEALEKEKEKYFKLLIEENAAYLIKEPIESNIYKRPFIRNILYFVAVLCVISIIFTFPLIILINVFNSKIDYLHERVPIWKEKISSLVQSEAVSLTNSYIRRVNALSDERKAELQERLKDTLKNLKPFIDCTVDTLADGRTIVLKIESPAKSDKTTENNKKITEEKPIEKK